MAKGLIRLTKDELERQIKLPNIYKAVIEQAVYQLVNPDEPADAVWPEFFRADVVNMAVPVEVERARRMSPHLKLEQPKVSIEGAFKRKRPREPFQRRLPIGGVYSDKKGQRLSRKPHRGWRRIA